jgi:hypothetical protein
MKIFRFVYYNNQKPIWYMQKNTTSILHSNSEQDTPVSFNSAKKNNREQAEPSSRVIENILNFSKALHIEPKADGEGFIEYVAN